MSPETMPATLFAPGLLLEWAEEIKTTRLDPFRTWILLALVAMFTEGKWAQDHAHCVDDCPWSEARAFLDELAR